MRERLLPLAIMLATAAVLIGVLVLTSGRKSCEQRHRDKGATQAQAWAACKPPPGL